MRVVRQSIILTVLSLLTIGFPMEGLTQPDAPSSEDLPTLRKEIQTLKEGQLAIQEDLQAIKELLTARQRPRSNVQDVAFTVNVAKDPIKGSADAQITLIEFTDYQCPYCARHTKTVLPQLTKEYIDTGKIRYVLRDFPLTSIHKNAAKAHEAAHCAGEQGKYWEMHDQLFAHPKDLQANKLADHAESASVTDVPTFQACLDSGKYEAQRKASVAEGTKVGVRGTPSFLLGLTEANGTVKATKLIRGAQPYPIFQQQINSLLAPPKSEGSSHVGTDG